MDSKWMKITAMLMSALVCGWQTEAQRTELRYTDYTVENGLSYNSVIDICQDTCGTIWFATNDGLNRFNGHDIYTYRHIHDDETSLPSNSLHKVLMDDGDRIWVCTSNGLAYYDAVADAFRKVDIPGAVSVEDMVQIDEDQFLVSTRNASYIYDKDKGTSTIFEIEGKPFVFYSACRDGDNIIICTRWKMIETLHVKDGTLCRKYEPFKIPRFGVVPLPAGNERYYIGTKGAGLILADAAGGSFRKIDVGQNGWHEVFSLAYDSEGKLWVGSDRGLMILKDDTCVHRSSFNEMKDKNIRSLFLDSSGGMWIGTEFAGVKYWNKKRDKFKPLAMADRLLSDEIITVLHYDEQGAIWAGTRYNGLDRYFPETGKRFHYELNNVRTICLSEDGKYAYTGAEVDGMHRIDLRTGGTKLLKTPIDAMSITRAANGKLWLGALVGLYLYDPRRDVSKQVDPPTKDKLIRVLSLYKDSHGRLWNGAKEHLIVYRISEDNSVKDVTPATLDGIVQVQCLYETEDGTMWIGTLDGLIAYRESASGDGEIEYIQGLQASTVRGIEEDNDGNLWVSTDNGLCRYIRETGTIRTYNKDDGLRCSLFNTCAHCKDPSGTMYFGGTNGVEVFDPKDISVNTETFRPNIEELTVNNISIKPEDKSGILKRNISLTEDITLRHWQNSITFRFSCPDMISGSTTSFEYMLDGFDKTWNTARGREATYTNLSKGKYIFRLKAANSDGIWCGTPRILRITVRPVWYKSTLARVVFMLALAGAAAVLLLKILKNKELEKKQEIERLTKEYEEKVQKTKLNMLVDLSYDLKPQEEAFLSSVLACVEKNISNPEFSVESLAANVCLSRGNLHLKVKTLTGKTPVELIKTMRMKKACSLMKETSLSIAEIAEQTGFQTPGYFITVFKSRFGETPGHYASRVRQK
ncbi:MAG TPA: hypothetical protein DDX40_06190 [Rikenellaceae bacterium]|nr:hypothetical protein [Rikenellaceae bacterium]